MEVVNRDAPLFSLVIPIYKNEENLPALFEALVRLDASFDRALEVVFVVDGSPDACLEILRRRLPEWPLRSTVVTLSRNFGSFCAITAGLAHGRGDNFGVIAADLQEPPELMIQFREILQSGAADIVFGYRMRRSDPWVAQLLSETFWGIYRRFVLKDIPRGGIDIFGCTRQVRDRLLALKESNTNLIALLFWLGFRRQFVPYERRARTEGISAWTFRKRLQYAINSIFNFTDLPIRLLLVSGTLGTVLALLAGIIVVIARITGHIPVLGYTPIVLLVAFFGGLTALGLGIVGQYLWLTLQNTRNRPNFIEASVEEYSPAEVQRFGRDQERAAPL